MSTTRRSLIATSALLAAARAFAHPALAQDEATPAAGMDMTPSDDAATLLGTWTGDGRGYAGASKFESEKNIFEFTTAHGQIVQGVTKYVDPTGVTYEEPLEVVLFGQKGFVGADVDGIFCGALHEDGSLQVAYIENGLDQAAWHMRFRKDGQPLPEMTADASRLTGRWAGPSAGYRQGDLIDAIQQMDIAEAAGPIMAGTLSYRVGENEWTRPLIVDGMLTDDDSLFFATPGGYMIGHMVDDATMNLVYLKVGMDNKAISMMLHREDARLAGTPMPAVTPPEVDLSGVWSGPRMEHDGGEVVGGIKELTITSREGSLFAGTTRWHNGDGAWFPTETLNVAVFGEGDIAMTDEDGVMLGRLLEDGTLELAYVSPGSPEPKANYNLLTRQS